MSPDSPDAAVVPVLSKRLTDPTPVLAIGISLWVVATVVVLFVDGWRGALSTCVTGVVVGVLGLALYLTQRAAARRGSKTAQRGLT